MLQNDFFYIKELNKGEGKLEAKLELNPEHRIFEGHFPGQPVVPGVCMVQMIKEVLQQALGVSLQLKAADHIKFLSVIDPRRNKDLFAEITYNTQQDEMAVVASIQKDDTTSLKLKGSFMIK